MLIYTTQDVVLFSTRFDDKHELIQKFRGFNNDTLTYNAPVDFMESGLKDGSTEDIFHVDIPLNYSNDEATPFKINGKHIGANHGQPSALIVICKNHGKTFADIGSVWQDEAGVKFTLLRINNESMLTFLSQNVGESESNYSFVTVATGNLTHVEDGVNTTDIIVEKQARGQLWRTNKYLEKRIYVFQNGEWTPMIFGGEYQMAEIREEYNIINPATVVEAVRKARPEGGYKSNVNLADYGKPMINLKLKYRVMPNGEVLCFFDGKKLMDVEITFFLGVMFQEKLDVYGGGEYRIIPKTKIATLEDGTFDFSKPVPLRNGKFPYKFDITTDYYENPDFPPDRIIDVFKDKEGQTKLGFSVGFLPIDDCAPEIRKNQLSRAVMMGGGSRKAYPFAVHANVNSIKGVGYKKFFPMKDENPVYTIDCDGKTYIYTHFVKQGTINLQIDGRVKLFEKGGDVEWGQDCTTLTISGSQGYAVFITE